MTWTVIDARPHHCGAMARAMRAAHRATFTTIGVDPHRAMRDALSASYFARAVMVDGHLAALGGVIGTTLDDEGHIWLALSEHATHRPVLLWTLARRHIEEIATVKRRLVTTVLHGDPAALRFATRLGFAMVGSGAEGVSMRLDLSGRV